MFNKEQIILDIDILLRRINNDIDGYYRDYYIYPERNILRDIYNNLQKASISYGRLVSTSLTEDTIFGEFASEDDSEILKICFQNIVKAVLNNYNIQLATNTIEILNKIQEDSKEYITDSDYEILSEIVLKINSLYYLKHHKEYEKVKDLFDLYRQIYKKYVNDIRHLIGNKVILEEFYKKISVILTIEDKLYRSTVCEYFKDRISMQID